MIDRRWASAGMVLLFLFTAVFTYRAYFITWANNPDVRVQYETTIATAMEYLNDHGRGMVAVSSISPDRYHSPAVGQMLLDNEAVQLRWFDARSSILLPQMKTGVIIIPGFTPMPRTLQDYFTTAIRKETLPMRPTDLDRPLDIYLVNRETMIQDWQKQLNEVDANFGDALQLLGYALPTPAVAPGDEVEIVTLWRGQRAVEQAVIFAHVVAAEGEPVAQEDNIGVPGYAWQHSDMFLQIHHFTIPQETAAGEYPLAVGIYTRQDGVRLPLTAGSQSGDSYSLTKLTVTP